MENLLTFSIAVTTAAVVIQAFILYALYRSVRKSSERMEALASEVKSKVLPAAETAQSMLVDLRPKIETLVDNLSQSSVVVRGQLQRMDATVQDVIDRTRLQVIRADELLSRTLDKVEETTEIVHKTVVSPVRQLSGLFHGVSAGMEFLFSGRRRRSRNGVTVPQDEMFI